MSINVRLSRANFDAEPLPCCHSAGRNNPAIFWRNRKWSRNWWLLLPRWPSPSRLIHTQHPNPHPTSPPPPNPFSLFHATLSPPPIHLIQSFKIFMSFGKKRVKWWKYQGLHWVPHRSGLIRRQAEFWAIFKFLLIENWKCAAQCHSSDCQGVSVLLPRQELFSVPCPPPWFYLSNKTRFLRGLSLM